MTYFFTFLTGFIIGLVVGVIAISFWSLIMVLKDERDQMYQMPKTEYTNLYDITDLQQKIVRFITYWVMTEKTPIPQKEIIDEMKRKGRNSSTVVNALNGLLKLGYIRRAVIISNKTFYVQLRKI